MSLPAEEIIGRIMRDAEEKVASILSTAQEQADLMERNAREEGERSLKKRREEANRKAAMEAGQILSIARMEARRMKDRAIAEAIGRCLALARERCTGISGSPEYREVMARLLKIALEELNAKEGTLYCHPRDRALFESLLVQHQGMVISVENTTEGGMQSGFVLVSRDGGIRIDQRLEERLRRMEADLVIETASILFPEGVS